MILQINKALIQYCIPLMQPHTTHTYILSSYHNFQISPRRYRRNSTKRTWNSKLRCWPRTRIQILLCFLARDGVAYRYNCTIVHNHRWRSVEALQSSWYSQNGSKGCQEMYRMLTKTLHPSNFLQYLRKVGDENGGPKRNRQISGLVSCGCNINGRQGLSLMDSFSHPCETTKGLFLLGFHNNRISW